MASDGCSVSGLACPDTLATRGLPNRTRLSLRVEARVVLCCVNMGMNGSSTRLEGLLAPTVEAMGFNLWGIEYTQRNRRGNLWVFIDSKKGVTIDDCARVSDQIEAVLDIEKVLPEDLRIQVSSPGMDRVLFKPEQFESYVGEVIDVRLLWPKVGRSHIRGRLCSSDTERFSVDMDEGQLELGFDQVRRARIVPTFN